MATYNQAENRISNMNFTDAEKAVIFADWDNQGEHYEWLMTATEEEIKDWIEAQN